MSFESLCARHRDYNQVVHDVRRSLRRFPPGLTQEEQELLQVKLNTLILRVLCEHQELHYYQVECFGNLVVGVVLFACFESTWQRRILIAVSVHQISINQSLSFLNQSIPLNYQSSNLFPSSTNRPINQSLLGYHDILVTFLLAVGEDLAFALMDRLSTHHSFNQSINQ